MNSGIQKFRELRNGRIGKLVDFYSLSFPSLRFLTFCLLLLASLFYVGCSRKGEQPTPSWNIIFFPLGAKIHFDTNDEVPIQRIRAFDRDTLVAQLDIGGYARRTESLYFRWKKGKMYQFEVTRNHGELTAKTVQAPQSDPRGSIDIAIPYGTVSAEFNASAQTARSMVLQGSEMTATVLVRNGLVVPVNFRVELRIPSVIQVSQLPSIWNLTPLRGKGEKEGEGTPSVSAPLSPLLAGEGPGERSGKRQAEIEETTLVASGKLTVESEVWYSQLRLKIPDNALPASTQISGHAIFESPSGDRWERTISLFLSSSPIDDIKKQLSIEKVLMPTDVAGVFDPRQRPDAISYSRPLFGGFGRWLGVKSHQINYFQPATYQTVRLRNRGQDTIHIIVTSMNRALKSGEAIPFLAPPDAINAGTNRTLAFVSLAGESTTDVPLPIYFSPPHLRDFSDLTGAGRYERAIEVKIWGSNATVLDATYPLLIVTPNRHALFVTGIMFVATSLGLFFLIGFRQRFFSRFTTKQLILIALFGATIFVLVSVPSTLLANLISALLGPIAFLITGLINEMLYYALLTSLLMLIRRSGVITLVSAVRLLLGGIMLGLLTPIALLYTGTTVLLLEAGFWLTRKVSHVLIWALVFGICDALAVYADFQLSITLYRLFYADWYILTRLLVDGFAYTFVGVLLGKRLGKGLSRVAE